MRYLPRQLSNEIASGDFDLQRHLIVLGEIERRLQRARTPVALIPNNRKYPYIDSLFPQQKAFVLDPSKNKAAKCGRRSGKTWADAAYLILEAERWDNCEVAYITLTRQTAKELMWPKLKWLNRIYRLGLDFNNSELIARTKNGSSIYLRGAHDRDDIEKLRGHAFKLVIIDEGQSFGVHIEELIDDVLDATLLDGDGVMALTGTPNAACVGRFHDVSTGSIKGWNLHEWTLFENPHLPHALEWLKKRMDARGWTLDHPVVQREYFGRWIRSLDHMVYRFHYDKNTVNGLPEKLLNGLYYILSIDLGYHDATAMTVGGWGDETPHFYLVDGFKKVGMLPNQVAAQIQAFMEKYEFTKIVADTGGLGKMLVEEFVQRYHLPVESAEKKAKNDFIELCNADLEQGIIKVDTSVPELKELASQLSVLQWDEKRRKEDPRYANDLADSFLYNWREARHFQYEKTPDPLDPNSEEYMDEYERREAQRLDRRSSGEGDFTTYEEDDDGDPFA